MANNPHIIAHQNNTRVGLSSLLMVWLLSLGFYFHQYMFRIIPSIALPAMDDNGIAHLTAVQFNIVLFIPRSQQEATHVYLLKTHKD